MIFHVEAARSSLAALRASFQLAEPPRASHVHKGEWDKLVGLPSPLPLARQMDVSHEVVAFAGRLWWVDVSWGVVSVDPFSDRPELQFVQLPRGSVTEPVEGIRKLGRFRRVGVSEGRLRYAEVSQKEPFVLSSFALDDNGSSWTLEHRVALSRLGVDGCHPDPEEDDTPRIGVIDPLNASTMYLTIGDSCVAVDMERGEVLGRSQIGCSTGPFSPFTGFLTPCVLPPWLEEFQIPSAGTLSSTKASIRSKTMADTLHLVGLDPNSDILRTVVGDAGATSDGLLLLDFTDIRATARVVANRRAGAQAQAQQQGKKLTGLSFNLHNSRGDTQERELAGVNTNPDITRLVCNPISGELFRLPDINGTKKTMFCHLPGLLTRSAQGHGHGPPDEYAVASLSEGNGRDGKDRGFAMWRFLSQTGEWDKLESLPSPLPLARQLNVHSHHEVVAFAGRIWWVDLGWGVISADPFSDRPELRFIELPRSSVLPEPTTGEEFMASVLAQGMYRRIGVSEGRLRYVEVSQKKPFVLSSFALDDDYGCWTLEHQVALGRPLENAAAGRPWQDRIPWICAIDPVNASVVCVVVGDHVLAVDMDRREVVGCSDLGECEFHERTFLIGTFLPCVLPPWLGSSRIPSAGKEEGAENKTLADVLVRSSNQVASTHGF
uniref:DUF1618 domain-containing protein n=1 Tax=Oryza barthii TaxID=65489 RepID=A0A0D3G542_9ORYZ